MTELHEPVKVDIDSIVPTEWNPNQEDVATFNNLVESIKQEGFTDPVTVVPVPDSDSYAIVRGEHRWKAAKLAGLTEITAIVRDDWDLDEQMVRSIRHNVIRGSFDAEKFTAIYERLRKKYDRDAIAKKLGMQNKESALNKLIGDVKRTMPKKMAEELDERANKIRNVEDLAAVVQSLYAKYGSTLDSSYMFLTFGGRIHLMLRMDADTKEKLEAKLDELLEAGEDANELIRQALDNV